MMSAPRITTGSGADAKYAYVSVTYAIVGYASTWVNFYPDSGESHVPQPRDRGERTFTTRNVSIQTSAVSLGMVRIAR
jgi:hypothetical protein